MNSRLAGNEAFAATPVGDGKMISDAVAIVDEEEEEEEEAVAATAVAVVVVV